MEPIEKYKPWEVKWNTYEHSWLVREEEVFCGYHATLVETGEKIFLYRSKETAKK